MVRGYTVEAEWDGATLTARGTNKLGRVGLFGPDHARGEISFTKGDVTSVEFRDANPLVNGRLTVHTTNGKKYMLSFRRRDRAAWRALYEQVQASLV